MKVSVQNICISTMNCRPRLSLQRTSTIVSFLSGVAGTSSAGRNSMVSISSPSSKGSRALRKLFAKSSCSPKMRLKVRSARGSRYFILAIIVMLRVLVLTSANVWKKHQTSKCLAYNNYKNWHRCDTHNKNMSHSWFLTPNS